jgi:hypothetical protein
MPDLSESGANSAARAVTANLYIDTLVKPCTNGYRNDTFNCHRWARNGHFKGRRGAIRSVP